jgi:uncharacterized membrane protein YgdD (TMEM256/DUF423 family)
MRVNMYALLGFFSEHWQIRLKFVMMKRGNYYGESEECGTAMFRTYGALGSVLALLAVALGAFGAHGLEDVIDDDLLSAFKTGVQYHMFHALGLLVLAIAADKQGETKALRWAARLLTIGIVLFSGSLYVMAVTDIRPLGAITPLGGVSFLAGWALLAKSFLNRK